MSNLPATHASSSYDPIARATKLIQLFCTPVDQFGILESAGPDEVPQPWRRLLNHQSHMTVAMERFYSAPVRLKVISQCTGTGTADRKPTPADWYAREILLLDPLGTVVQYGVVRLDLRQLNASTLTAVLAAEIPLGRILIAAGELLEVQQVQLLRVVPGPHLAGLLRGDTQRLATSTSTEWGPTFGRVATILLAGQPAIELLEIVAPCATRGGAVAEIS